MAIFLQESEVRDGDFSIIEQIEVRPWRLGGKSQHDFVIGSGSNFNATTNILIEIIYSVNNVQLFYTRNFIHHVEFQFPVAEMFPGLEKFKTGEHDGYGFGDMLPETSVILKRNKHIYTDGNEEQQTYIDYSIEISADVGAGVGKSGPGVRMIDIKFADIEAEAGIEFMRQLTSEIADLYQGKNPDPENFPPGSSDWNFARQVNQKAYDTIAMDYEEEYFSEQLLTENFDAWLQEIPAGGHILDLGCGHGKPVVSRLTEKGYGVTGADLSPKMLERARENFPNVRFVNQLASEMNYESEFDGACSLSSMLYLDPVDLSHSIYRMYHALKPNGLLFLYAYDLHPNWRGAPYHVDIKQWMWGWTYGMDEAVQFLEEHGCFKVLKAQDVTSEEEKQSRIEKWYEYAKGQYDENLKRYPNLQFPAPDQEKPPSLSYKYIIVAQRQTK